MRTFQGNYSKRNLFPAQKQIGVVMSMLARRHNVEEIVLVHML